MNTQSALKSQYHAALAMLKQAIDLCPDELWTADGHPSQFWQIGYHTLFFTHLYLQPNLEAFKPWEFHREEYQFLQQVPWPPHEPPKLAEPYSKSQVLDYWRICDAMIDADVDRLDLEAEDCGFSWYEMPKLHHQLMNVRHIQHHAAVLADRLPSDVAGSADWIGGGP